MGAKIELSGSLPTTSLLFSESPSRIILSVNPAQLDELRTIAERNRSPFSIIGTATGASLRIAVNGQEVVAQQVAELETAWRTSLSHKLEAEAMVAGME